MNMVIRFLFVVNHLAIKAVQLFNKVLNKVFPNIQKKYDYRLAAVLVYGAGNVNI